MVARRAVGVGAIIALSVSSVVGVPAVASVEAESSFIVELAPSASVDEVSTEVLDGEKPTETYGDVLNGFAAELTPSEVAELESSPDVVAVYEDFAVSVGATQSDAPWNLSRLDQATVPADSMYTYPDSAGSGTRIYIVDTGIAPNAAQFGSRLLPGVTTILDGQGTNDCNGHGTHVAGTAASTTYGVAKQAFVVPVRVFPCSGGTPISTVIAGLDWIVANHPAGTPGIVNLSLGSDTAIPANEDLLSQQVDEMANQGFVMVVAAGNSNANACSYSPSRAANALTVGATQTNDSRASFSNFGACVDLFAPGTSIRSLQWNNPAGSMLMQGTSMAAPHVAGIAALALASNPGRTSAETANDLVSNALPGGVTSAGAGSPNRLSSVGWLSPPLDPFGVPASVVARDSSGALWLYPLVAGQFTPRLSLGTEWSTFATLTGAGDLTGDGYRDLLSTGPGSVVNLHRGTPESTFNTAEPVAGSWSGLTAIFSPGDFNGDGHNDLLSRSTSGNLFLHANDGTGVFAAPRQVGNGWAGLTNLFGAGDFNGDGFADVMARDASARLMLYSGNGRGGWLGGAAVGTGWGGFSSIFSAGDVDGDGAPDVLGRLPNGDLYLYSGNGLGSVKGVRQISSGWNAFTSVSGFGGGVSYPFLQSAGAGDVNRDGTRDVVTVTNSGAVFRYLGNGTGSWLGGAQAAAPSFSANRIIAGVGDINSSGTDDLIAVDTSGQLVHYDGDGAGGYAAGAVVGTGWGSMTSVFVVGDGDGNRTFDLVARDAVGDVWFYPGTGALAWGSRTLIASGWGGYTALFPAGDFNGDKNPDMIARSSTGLLFLIAGVGGGSWSPAVQIGNGWQSMTSLHSPGDFDGDGRADVIARDATGSLWLYRGDGKGSWLGGRMIGWGWQGFRWIG